MKSYASVDQIHEILVKCEVEMISIEQSREIEFGDRECQMLSFDITQVEAKFGKLHEGDILIVEHSENQITKVCGKDDAEKQRRIDFFASL